jgi:uncharacterized repeat protein (TIGR01451 family)
MLLVSAMAPAALASGFGTVQATVTDANGSLLEGECLTASGGAGAFTTTPSDVNGFISQTNVPAGHYGGYFDDCSSTGYGGTAVSFEVADSTTTDLGTKRMPADGGAFGKLLDSRTGKGAPYVSITAWSPSREVMVAPPTCTDTVGRYSIFDLPTTGVKLELSKGGCQNDAAYSPEWYGGTAFADASIVFVAAQCCGLQLDTVTLTPTTTSGNGMVTITGVTFSGGSGNPELVVTGSGFGATAPAGVDPGCPEPPTGAGQNFGTKIYFNDYSAAQWQAGTGGDCIGLVLVSWSETSVDFTLGSWYSWPQGGGGQGVILADGDPYTMTLKGAHFTGIAVYDNEQTDLGISQSVDDSGPSPGGSTVTFTSTVSDGGPDDATGVTVTDTLPPDATFVPAGSSGSCSLTTSPNVVTCDVGSVANGANAQVGVQVITGCQSGSATNTAAVAADQPDPNPADNSSTASTEVTTPCLGADLGITQGVDVPGPAPGGSNVTFTSTVSDGGPDDATGVTVTDTLPPGATFVPAGSSGSCSLATPPNIVTCDVGSVANGANAQVAVQVITACRAETATNLAVVAGDQVDPSPSDDSSNGATQVSSPCGGADQQVNDGGTVSTDPNGTGPEPGSGIFATSSLAIPPDVSGQVAITVLVEGSYTDCPSLPQVVAHTDQPASDSQHPIKFIFTYDVCTVPPGTRIRDTTFTKSTDGQTYLTVPRCSHINRPDPCVRRQRSLPNGDFRYVVLWSGVGDPSWRPH